MWFPPDKFYLDTTKCWVDISCIDIVSAFGLVNVIFICMSMTLFDFVNSIEFLLIVEEN